MKQLTLKNYFLYQDPSSSLQGFFGSLQLHGKESRMRSKFIKILIEQAREIDQDRREILMDHCEKRRVGGKDVPVLFYQESVKGKDGVVRTEIVKTVDSNKGTNYSFLKPEDEDEFNKKWTEYLNEEFKLDILPSLVECVHTARDLVLNTSKEFSGPLADLYDEWCNAFENIKDPDTELAKP